MLGCEAQQALKILTKTSNLMECIDWNIIKDEELKYNDHIIYYGPKSIFIRFIKLLKCSTPSGIYMIIKRFDLLFKTLY